MRKLSFPYKYEVEYHIWEKSYLYDVDGEGRVLFSDLTTIGAYFGSELIGFIQYGKTAFGFDNNGEVSDKTFYPVIRNFYFDESQKEAGMKLLNEAVKALSNTADRIYAFFHYFGMSALKHDLFNRGIIKFDTDTALTNKAAQHFYEKNNFVKEGITRSYYKF